MTRYSQCVTQVTARYAGLVGDPALCWNSTHRRGSLTGAQGRNAAPGGGGRGSRTSAGHSDHTGGAQCPPSTPTPSYPFSRRDAWSRGCDASAGTFQEGWQRCGGAGAAGRDWPQDGQFLAPARPEPPGPRKPLRFAGRRGEWPDGAHQRALRSLRRRPERRRTQADGTRGHGLPNSPAQLAHLDPTGRPCSPSPWSPRPPSAGCASTSR